jgi:hypothetical protein
MSNIFEEDAIELELGDVNLQAMARRQVVASLAVAAVIGLGVILMATAPTSRDYAGAATHKPSDVEQPRFVRRATDIVAEATQRHEIELP